MNFEGLMTAIVTPMQEGRIDEAGLRALVRKQVEAGVNGLIVCGSTGEGATLSDSEQSHAVRLAAEAAGGRTPIVAGVGARSTAGAIRQAQRFHAGGADALLVVTPAYNKPTQAGILTHFRLVADATDLPVILYDIPGRTGVPIRYETILRLAKHPNILAIKDAKGDFSEVSRVLNQTDLLYFSGDDANVLPHLSIGASGLIGVTANIAAQPYREIVNAVNAGDLTAATAAHRKLEPLVRAVMTHVPGTVSAKYILHGLGRITSPRVRLPLVGPEEWEAAKIEDELALVSGVPGADFSNFRPDRNAAAGGALPKVSGTTR